MRELLELLLERDGYEIRCAANGREALELLRENPFDLVITDIRMEPVNGLEVLKQCKALSPRTVVIMISAFASTELAVEAMNEGAYDYFPKPFNNDEILSVIANALKDRGVEEKGPRTQDGPLHFGCIIGESPPMRRIYETIRQIAKTGSNVLVTGESGTGKELVAKAIHRQSPRHDQPFVVVNCGGVPENLIESELFGYKKGAFTGATANRKGLVEAAQGGTLFLDEIGELSPVLQVKLLRLAQEKTIKMVGGTEDIPVDVRIISATNRDLFQQTQNGSFRQDLYYRIHVVSLRLPPLRERADDIPLIFEHYLRRFAGKAGHDAQLTAAARETLKAYAWPGNIRQLRNVAEVVAYGDEELIDARHIHEVLGDQERASTPARLITIPESASLKQMESEIIRNLLAKHSADEVCARLGISRVTLWRKMKNLENGAASPLRR